MEFLWLSSVLMMACHAVCSVRADVAILKQPFIPAVKTNPSIEGYTQYVYSKPFSTIAQCPNLKYPANCAVMITGNLPGDTATYLCEEHFAQVEARTLICNKNGLWSDIPSMRRSVDGTFVVGFVETSYTVIEGDGQVEVCVNLISPEGDIGDERVLVEVFNNTDPGSIPADAAAATADTLTLSGFYRMDERADYQPLIIGFNPIRNMVITGTSRIICYNQIIYDNDRAEENEIFSLTMTVQDGSAVTTQVDSQLSSAIIIIWDDDNPLSSVGTEFVSYQTCNRDHTPVQWLFVTTPENISVDFSVSDGTTTVYHTVAPNSNQTIDVCSTFSTVSEVQGILIRSSDGVSKLIVMELVFIHNDISSDSFIVFPPHHYPSYNYFALSVEPTNSLNYRSFVQIVGSEDNTQVTITPTQDASIPAEVETDCSETTITAGITCTLNLQKLQALRLLSIEDLTGTKIVSDKPLSVFSGTDCAHISPGNCETLIEQIPPVATWGKTFLVGSIEGRAEEIYKVVAAKANTEVSVYCVNSTSHFSFSVNLLGEGSSHNFSVGLQRTCSIRADKPILLMLLAPNSYLKWYDGAFMSLVPPVRQYTSTVTVIMPHDGNVTITLPVESCPGSQCSVIVGESHTPTTTSAPIHCSLNEVCGYVMVANLSAGVHKLRTPDVETGMGVTAYAFTSNLKSGYGTISTLGLNYIPVGSPEIVVEVGHGGGGHPLVAGDSLTLTCNVTVTQEGMSDGVTMSVGWFKGEENEEIKSASVIDVHDKEIGSYTFEHSFEALSTEDSNTYKCEANLWFHTIGLLATASHSVGITVQARCPNLVNPDNGVVSISGNSPGDTATYTATYTCNDGFDLVGASERVCGKDGEWSEEPPMCIHQEKGSMSPALISIVTPVGMSALIAIIIAIATVTIMLVLWKRRKQGEDGSHDSPDHVYDVPDYITNIVSQNRLESETRQNEIAMKITSHAVLSPNEMKSNIAYGCGVSGQQRSTDITTGGVEYSDMQPNIAYGCGASDQQGSIATDVTPGGVEYSDMHSNIAYGCVVTDQCHDTEQHSSEMSTL